MIILDAPTCRPSQKNLYGVARTETVNISCEVESDPSDVTFRWALNNTVENMELHNFTSDGIKSTLTFTPRTMLEFGAILCWGINSVGEQKDPCVVRIIPAGEFIRSYFLFKNIKENFSLHIHTYIQIPIHTNIFM